MSIKNEEIKSLLSFFEKSDWQELRLEVGEVKIAVSKNGSLAAPAAVVSAAPAPGAAIAAPAAPAAPPAVAPAAGHAAAASTELAPGQVYLRAPSLGVVWGQSKPGAPPFVQEGQQIEAGTPLCLIEVMKLFTQVTSNVKGRVVRRLVADGEMVEHDEPLFIIEVA